MVELALCFTRRLVHLCWLLAPFPALLAGLAVTHVNLDNRVLSVTHPVAPIRFTINEPASVLVKICDARNILVDKINAGEALPPGEHKASWNGVSLHGDPLPPGAYSVIIEAVSSQGEKVIWDLTDSTGGETLAPQHIAFDRKKRVIRYRLIQTGRVFIRVGIEESSVQRTIANGVVRLAGDHEEPWDGMDASGIIDLAEHPHLQFSVDGYRLSDNTVILLNDDEYYPQQKWMAITAGNAEKRVSLPKRRGLDQHAYHSPDQCRDVHLHIDFPDDLPVNEQGLPIVSGKLPIRITARPGDAALIESQRFEIVFFLNNQMLYENEASYLPYTWTWNPVSITEGINYLTAFIVTFEGHFAVANAKFVLRNSPERL